MILAMIDYLARRMQLILICIGIYYTLFWSYTVFLFVIVPRIDYFARHTKVPCWLFEIQVFEETSIWCHPENAFCIGGAGWKDFLVCSCLFQFRCFSKKNGLFFYSLVLRFRTILAAIWVILLIQLAKCLRHFRQ